ncbi:MAG TPA: indole-3-glycerol phosphate synthase TrpC [Terriglobales bacterium]|nr:indole-3-glycerol phosphate synthase TrpC [Terriglobales bacterium]
MPATLDQIVAATRRVVASAKASADFAQLERYAREHRPRRFARAVRETANREGLAVIAELKKASPSRGVIRASFHPQALATELEQNGATALSVLTNEEFFQGSLDYLREASAAVHIPCLRKDFIVDEFQVLEARANCADAILLIVAALTDPELRQLHAKARSYDLDVLCEVHEELELKRAIDCGFEAIGVNNRNLRTFEVDLTTSLELISKFPPDVTRVAESGIHTGMDLHVLREAGYHAFLIGESLMKNDHPGQELGRQLAELRRASVGHA